MMLIDFRKFPDFQPPTPGLAARGRCLKVDDLLSRSGDDLGLDIDESGRLILVEGRDFE